MVVAAQRENLGRIEIKGSKADPSKALYVNMLPTEYKAILVNLTTLQTSCVLPPRKLEITYRRRPRNSYRRRRRSAAPSNDFSKMTLEIPSLLFVGRAGQIPETRAPRFEWSLLCVDEKVTDQLKVTPYLMANVHHNGGICFSGLQPANFRQAYNYFFGSAFNSDLSNYNRIFDGTRRIHFCNKLAHDYYRHGGCKCLKTVEHTCCVCPTDIFHTHSVGSSTTNPISGCGCTTVIKSKKCKGQCATNPACTCCIALNNEEDAALSCGCTMRHKRNCTQIKGTCACPCKCICCTKECGHTVCKCQCCSGTCNCRCLCDPADLFEQYIQNYGDKVLPHQMWQVKTDEICGKNFWSTSEKADGLLLTSHPDIMEKVPRQYWKKSHLQNSKAFICCVGRNDGDVWRFESSKYQFTVNSKELTFDSDFPQK